MKKLGAKEILLFVVCVVTGVLLVTQVRNPGDPKLYVSATSIDDYEAVIASERASIDSLKEQIAQAELTLQDYEVNDERSDNKIMEEKLSADIKDFSILSGNEKVHGEGVRITVDDGTRPLYAGEDINDVLVHDIDILMIINELKKCKAEAIAVNGHRVTPDTSIVCSGYTVKMDGTTYARPFVITALGDSRRITNVLLSSEGYGTALRSFGVQFAIEHIEDITIPASDGVRNYQYAQAVSEEKEGEN